MDGITVGMIPGAMVGGTIRGTTMDGIVLTITTDTTLTEAIVVIMVDTTADTMEADMAIGLAHPKALVTIMEDVLLQTPTATETADTVEVALIQECQLRVLEKPVNIAIVHQATATMGAVVDTQLSPQVEA